MKDVVINVDGTQREVSPANGSDYSLEEMRDLIGCKWIQIINTHDGRSMVIDEEGKLTGKEINMTATGLYQYGKYDPVVGNVLVCGSDRVR
jgi:hypothetical protein